MDTLENRSMLAQLKQAGALYMELMASIIELNRAD